MSQAGDVVAETAPRFGDRDSNEVELTDEPTGKGHRRMVILLSRLALGVVAILMWQVASGRWIEPFWISSPSEIWQQLKELALVGDSPWAYIVNFPQSDLWFHVQYTMRAMLLGLLWGASFGMIAGFILGRSRFLGELLNPVLVALYSMPKLALAPLFILWFGIGIETKIVYAGVVVFFLVFLNTYSGVREVDRDLVDAVQILGAGRIKVMTKIVIPSALAWVFAGLTLSVPYALVGAVTAEMLVSNRGMGYLVVSAANQFDTGGVFAALVVLVIVAVVVNFLVERARNYLLRWKGAGA